MACLRGCVWFLIWTGTLFLLSAVQVAAKPVLPADALTTYELKSLLFDTTAEVVFGKSERGLRYFSPFGKLHQVKSNRLQKGSWKVNDRDRLCTKFGESSWDCRILLPNGKGYQQYVVKKNGKHKLELTYLKFYSGRKLAELAGSPLLPAGTLDKKQLIELFSGKTVETVTAKKGRVSLSYYDPSGRVEQLRTGVTRDGKWRVNNSDRICLQMQGFQEKCRIVVQEGNLYKKYIVKKNGRHQHSVTYRAFSAGNRL